MDGTNEGTGTTAVLRVSLADSGTTYGGKGELVKGVSGVFVRIQAEKQQSRPSKRPRP